MLSEIWYIIRSTDGITHGYRRWPVLQLQSGGHGGRVVTLDLASHLCGRGSIPVMAVSGKAGSCLPLVGSLQYRTLANYMYWFPLPFQLPVVI